LPFDALFCPCESMSFMDLFCMSESLLFVDF